MTVFYNWLGNAWKDDNRLLKANMSQFCILLWGHKFLELGSSREDLRFQFPFVSTTLKTTSQSLHSNLHNLIGNYLAYTWTPMIGPSTFKMYAFHLSKYKWSSWRICLLYHWPSRSHCICDWCLMLVIIY
jgi:hypothetical protein